MASGADMSKLVSPSLNGGDWKLWVDIASCANKSKLVAKHLSFKGEDWMVGLARGQEFEITGTYDINLTGNTKYEVVLVIKMEEDADGREDPVSLKLQLPNGTVIEKKTTLSEVGTNICVDIRVQFSTSEDMAGKMIISLSSLSKRCKKGIVIEKVIIRPVEE